MADTTTSGIADSEKGLRLQPLRDMAPIAIILILLALVPNIATALDYPFLIKVATRVSIFALAAVALNIVLGFGGLVSLMHAGLFGIGGYTIGILAQHDFNGDSLVLGPLSIAGTSNLLVTLPLAVLFSGLAAAIMGVVALRTSGSYFIMITLAFNQMLYYFFVALQPYGGEDGLQILSTLTLGPIDVSNRVSFYYVCVALLGCVLVFAQRMINSRFGMVLRATAQNERRVRAVGIPALPYKLVAFAISGALTGLAGALLATGQQFISPADMSWVRSGDLVVMAVMGGLATVWGPALGAAAFLVLELVLSSLTTSWHLPFGLIIIALAVFLKGGLRDLFQILARKKEEG